MPVSALPSRQTVNDKELNMPFSAYMQLRDAILNRQQVVADYQGHRRLMCPHAIGTGPRGNEQLMAYQFDGTSSKGDVKLLSADDRWRCIPIDGLTNVIVQTGEWHTGENHSTKNTCLTSVDVEVSY